MKIKRNGKSLLVISLMLLVLVVGCTEEEATIACAPDEEECATETEEGFAFGPAAGIAAGAAAVVALAGGLSGGGDDSGSGGSTGGSLKAAAISTSDFNVVSTTSRTEESMKEWINNESRFYSNMPSEGGGVSVGGTARGECIENMENEYGSITKKDAYYEYKLEVDIKNCNSIDKNVKSEIKSYYITKIDIDSNSLNSDLSKLKINEISYSSWLSRSSREVIYTNNNKYVYKYIMFKGSDETSPCLAAVNNVFDDCEQYHLWTNYYNYDLSTVTGIYIEKFGWNDVVEGNGIFKESGSVYFRRDDWAGSVEFIGTNNPSNYYATDGNSVITGTLDTSQISNQIDLDKPHFTRQQARR